MPGGGVALDGSRWISTRAAFLPPVRVLGKLFRRLFLNGLVALHDAGRLAFFGSLVHLADSRARPARPASRSPANYWLSLRLPPRRLRRIRRLSRAMPMLLRTHDYHREGQLNRAKARRSRRLSASNSAHPSGGRAIADIDRR